jgi:hypothetical protein
MPPLGTALWHQGSPLRRRAPLVFGADRPLDRSFRSLLGQPTDTTTRMAMTFVTVVLTFSRPCAAASWDPRRMKAASAVRAPGPMLVWKFGRMRSPPCGVREATRDLPGPPHRRTDLPGDCRPAWLEHQHGGETHRQGHDAADHLDGRLVGVSSKEERGRADEGPEPLAPVVTREIAAEAGVWIARLHGPERSNHMERECRAWQAKSAAHRLGFERGTDLWMEAAGVNRAAVARAAAASAPEVAGRAPAWSSRLRAQAAGRPTLGRSGAGLEARRGDLRRRVTV